MSKTKVVLNIAGFNELRNSPEMRSLLKKLADQKAKEIGDCETEVYGAGTRAVAKIISKKKSNHQNAIKAVKNGR